MITWVTALGQLPCGTSLGGILKVIGPRGGAPAGGPAGCARAGAAAISAATAAAPIHLYPMMILPLLPEGLADRSGRSHGVDRVKSPGHGRCSSKWSI